MRRLVFMIVSAVILNGACLTSSVRAQEPEPIVSALAQIQQNGLSGGAARIIEWKQASYLEFSRIKPPIKLWSSSALRITFPLPAFGHNDNLAPAFKELLNTIRSACLASGGDIELNYVSVETSDLAVRKALSQLRDPSPFAQHICQKGTDTLFLVQLSPSPTAQGGLPPYNWNVFLHVIYKDVFSRLADRQAKAALEAERFRETLAPSTMVAIAARDLPEAARPKIPGNWQRSMIFETNDYRVCGMVIQSQGPLVQVQVATQSLFVKREAIWPHRKSIGFGSSMSADWENWCIGQ